MYRLKHILGQKEKQLLFRSFVIANFNFCPVVWTFCGTGCIRKIEGIQERALKFLTNDSKSSYPMLLLKEYKSENYVALKVTSHMWSLKFTSA